MNKAKYADCSVCPLQPYRLCPSFGPKNPKLIVVGEGPGNQELVFKRPFVGQSGKLLRQMLSHVGFDPMNDVAYTNATLCDPNSSGDTKERRMGKAVPACNKRLHATLEAFGGRGDIPVLALGKWARKALGIEANSWQREKLTDKWAIGTDHPAYAFHMEGALVHIERVLEKVAAFQPKALSHPEPRLIKHPNQLPSLDIIAGNESPICVDIESNTTVWYQPDGFIFTIGIAWSEQVWIIDRAIINHPKVVTWLQLFFKRFSHRIGGHNFKFDTLFLHRQFQTGLEFGWDTILMANNLNEYWLKGLKDLGAYYFDTGDWGERLVDSWLKTNIKKNEGRTYDKVPQGQMNEYLTMDVWYNLLLHDKLKRELQAVGRWERPYKEFELPVAKTLTEIEWRGFPIDLGRVTEEEVAFEVDRLEAMEVVQTNSSGSIENPNSYKQVANHLWDELKVPYPTHKGSYPSTAENVLLAVEELAPIVGDILQYRRIAKLKGSYLSNLHNYYVNYLWSYPTVHPSYKQAHVITGRLSAVHPAIQTIPKKNEQKDGDKDYGKRIKSCYTAIPDHSLIFVDGSQWELRVTTVWSQDPWMIEAYRSGMDVHGMACDAIYGKGWTKAQRTVEKNVMFGSLYGGTLESLVSVGTLSDAQKQWVLDFFYEELGVMTAWRTEMFEAAKQHQTIVSPHFNRCYHFPFIHKGNLHDIRKYSVNYPVQGTASQITLDAAAHARTELKGIGAWVVATVHDSVGLVAPNQVRAKAIKIMCKHLEAAGTRFNSIIPWVADWEIGYRWGELKEASDMKVRYYV